MFDADVHLDNVVSRRHGRSGGDFIVQSRKMMGYVQLAPSSILLPARIFADLLNFQNGSLGGPVDCIIDIAQVQAADAAVAEWTSIRRRMPPARASSSPRPAAR